MAAGLVLGEGFAVDASVNEANARRFQRVEKVGKTALRKGATHSERQIDSS
jgi:hypothetical protein